MRVQGIVIFVAAFGAAQASASSIQTLAAIEGNAPSIVALGDNAAIDPSIVAAISTTGPSPSITVLADTPSGATPSIVTLGEPAPAGEEAAATSPSQRMTTPTVIRGGEVGQVYANPSPAPTQAATQPGVPLLDPNDRGTPSKRRALKRQAERLAARSGGSGAEPSGRSVGRSGSGGPVATVLARDLREIRDLTGRRADAGEQRQTVGAHGQSPHHSRERVQRMNQLVHATR